VEKRNNILIVNVPLKIRNGILFASSKKMEICLNGGSDELNYFNKI